ncbi:hypothetical protein GF351_04755 [Candidatus Woesearchaeota archaeon]|nr:hypothetical protein [Candidatus Woesearchaeota archaeon]
MEIKKRYSQLQKKHSLPTFDEIDHEFEINSIEEDSSFILREIRRRMVERIEEYSKIFEEIIQPDTNSFRSMSECRVFKDEDKHEIFNIYKNIMIIIRSAQIISLERDENKEAKFINSVFQNWMRIKKELMPYLEKLEKSWEKESEMDETIGYLG